MKKAVFIINIIVFVLVCTFLVFGVERNEALDTNVGTQESIQKIEENTSSTTENILQNLMFNGEALPYDTETATFYLPLSMKNESWEFGELSAADKGVSILFAEDFSETDKLTAIANNQSFSFLAFTNEEHRYYNLVFTGLPIMNITVNEGSMEESAQIDMSLYSSNTKSDWVKHSMATLRIRGDSATLYPKKAYKMELTKLDNTGNTVNNDVALLNMRKDNDWILYAMYSDETKVRDKLSIDIWNEFGANDNPFSSDFGTKLEYVELIVNGEYYGIYGLMEPVDAKKLDITKASSAESQEYIYKRTDPVGLLLEEFMEDSDTIIRSGFELKGISKYGEISLKSWEPLMNFIRVNNLEDSEQYLEEIEDVVDINSVTNAWVFLQIVSGTDNRGKNMYYVAKMTSSGIRLFFVPWDLDLTWGNVSKEGADLYIAFEPEILTELVNWETGQNVIDTNAGNSVSLAKEKWEELRGTILTDETLIERIEELEHTVLGSGAMARETKRWPDGGHTTDYSSLKQYALDKMSYLDTFFETLGEE